MHLIVFSSTDDLEWWRVELVTFARRRWFMRPLMTDRIGVQFRSACLSWAVTKHADMNLLVALSHEQALNKTKTDLVVKNIVDWVSLDFRFLFFV